MKIEVNGVSLFYTVLGQELETVVLVHGGFGLDHSYLRGFAEQLAKHFTVYLLDLRNSGASERCNVQSCSTQQITDDLLQFCHQLNIERPFILGHSLGGNIALGLAAIAPSLVRGVVCLGAAHYAPTVWVERFREKGGDVAAQAAQQHYKNASAQTLPAFMQCCVPLYNSKPLPAELIAGIDINFELLLFSVRSLYPYMDLTTAVEEVTCPVLLLDGDEDPVVQNSLAQQLAEQHGYCTSIVITGGGHESFHSHPKKCMEAILAWVSSET